MNKPIASACISALSAVLIVLMGFALPAGAAAAPNTIPAVQSWTTGTGTCVFSTTSRIVVNTADSAALIADARTFAQDLNGLLSRAVTVAVATSANAGDVFLHLGSTDATLGTEGYIMTIATTIDINARAGAAAGVFYGTRTVLQMFKQSTTVNQGTIRDYPLGTWRGQMMDVGRKYYTVAWLQTLIRDMAYVKMNMLHMHLSDGISATNNGGFRLQSTVHPEITSTQYYSPTEIQGLITLATKYHIIIMPEIDLPGHVNWLYNTHHKNCLLNRQVLGTQYWALDLSKDSTYNLVNDILNEFIPVFPGPFWDLGADEYMFIDEFASFPQLTTWATSHYGSGAHANDCYRHFTNWANGIVKSKGKKMWAWNDVLLGITGTKVGACTLATDIDMDHWGALDWIGWGGVFPAAEHALGYNMMNCSWDVFYVIGKSLGIGDPTWVYNSWELYTYGGGNLPAGDAHILGGKFPVWGDVPTAETEAQVWTNTFQLNRAIAQKVWGSPKIQATAPNFQTMANTIGRAPVPVVSIKNRIAPITRASGRIESVQIFDLRGVLLKSVSGDALGAVSASGNQYRFVDNDATLTTGSYLCRFKGKGFERTEKILLVR
jgi:hexosaminidase